MNKIRVIDLLNKIANGEEVPSKIKYDNIIFEYDGDYYSSENNVLFEEYCYVTTSLNDEVEVIEEDKKIEKLPYYSLERIQKAPTKDTWFDERITLLEQRINDYHEVINELIDEVNKLKEEK